MTEENSNNIEQTSELDPGELLRLTRESAGFSIDDVAQKLYLKSSAVEALENNQLDNSRSLTFTKGYVKNYARLLGLDIAFVVAQFEAYHNRSEDTAKLQSFSKRVAKQAHDDRWMMVTYFILIVIIAGVVWWWLQQPKTSVGETRIAPIKETTETPVASGSVTRQIQPPATEQSTPAQASDIEGNNQAAETAVETIDSVQQPAEEDRPLDAVTEDLADEVADDAATEPAITVSADSAMVPVTFTFAQDCWVNIVDGTGEAIAYGVKDAGYVMELEGLPPFEITLGAPQVVAIVYDGEPVDMSGFTGNQIGRLILPQQD